MSTANPPDIDWSITTFEAVRREQLRRILGTAFCSCACSVQAYGKSTLHRGTP
jgi:hypothetical protein